MKLITLVPTPQHVVSADIAQRAAGQVIDISVWAESKIFRAISVTDYEIEKGMGRSFGRASNSFYLAREGNKDVLLYIQGSGDIRKIVRIDAEIEVLKRLLRTSVNDYPQGKFLFNLDKHRPFYEGLNWLYDLTKKPINDAVFVTPVAEMILGAEVQSFKEVFPLLNRAIPSRIHKGLFFTENEVYWLDRPADTLIRLTDKFYSDKHVVEPVPVETFQDDAEHASITLPYRDSNKKWISPRNEFDVLPHLIKDIVEHIAIAPATRIVTQNKLNHKTYGQYFIPTQGIYGKEMLSENLVKNFTNRLGDAYSIVMRGQGFEMLYTKADVNAVYLRQRGDVQYSCDVVVEKPPLVEEPTPIEVEVPTPVVTSLPEMSPEEYTNRRKQLCPQIEEVVDAVIPVKEPEPMEKATVIVPHDMANLTELDQWYQDLFESPVLYSTNIELQVTRLAMNRAAIVQLPEPYGNLLAWVDITHDRNVGSLGLNNNDLVSFASATLYVTNGRIFMTETHVRLDTTPVAAPVVDKTPKEELEEAVKRALAEMSLGEVLAVVSAAAI